MSKFLSLVKLLFVQQYRIKPNVKLGKNGKPKRGGTVALIILLAVCFLPMLVSAAVATYYLGKLAGPNSKIAAVLVMGCQSLVLLFGIATLISNVFMCKDADRLLYLPVRSSTIFLAKLTVAYVNEVITTVVTVLVMLLPYGIGAQAGVGFYLLLIPALLLIPLFPMLVGSIVAMPLSALITRIGKNGALRTVLQVLLFVSFMAVYLLVVNSFGVSEGDDMAGADIAQMLLGKIESISQYMVYFHPNYMLTSAMFATSLGKWLLYGLASIGENALLLAIVVLIALPFYRWMLSAPLETSGRSKRKKGKTQPLQVKQTGVIRQLISTDAKRVVRDGQMGFQAFGGLILMPLIVVILAISFMQEIEPGVTTLDVLRGQPLYQLIAPLGILAYLTLLGIGSNVLGLYPISRENKSLYMLKSLPLPFGKILLSKVLFATAINLACDLVTSVLVVALLGVKWYWGVLMLITMCLVCFGSMCITTLCDLKSPKVGWTNFQQSLKNAKNSWIAMLIGFACCLGLFIVAVGFVLWFVAVGQWYVLVLMWLALIGASFAYSAVTYKIMADKAQRYFERIEA